MKTIKSAVFISLVVLACGNSGNNSDVGVVGPAITEYSQSLPLNTIKLPQGFKIEIFAEVPDARSMAVSPSGIVYVGNKDKDKVYALQDTDGDHKADKKWVIASGLNMPNGVAFHEGDLYVAEVSRILKFQGIESKLDNPGSPVVISDDYPTARPSMSHAPKIQIRPFAG